MIDLRDYGFDQSVPQPIQAIREHAVRAAPDEACGLLLLSDVYLPCINISPDPKRWRIDSEVMRAYDGAIRAVVHSHPLDGREMLQRGVFPDAPSIPDMRAQIAHALPFGIVVTDGTVCSGPFFWGEGLGRDKLVGREYRDGVADCYALVRDWHASETGLELPEIPRSKTAGKSLAALLEEYLPGLPVRRFKGLDDLRRGDVLILGGARKPMEPKALAVYVGDSEMLVQFAGVPSRHASVVRAKPLIRGVLRWQA